MKHGFFIWVLFTCWSLGDTETETGSGDYLHKAPFISPHAIHQLFDGAILSFDLSALDNRLTNFEYWIDSAETEEGFPTLCFQQEFPFSICATFFSYRFLKQLPNRIDVLYVVESGGGSGIFHSLYFVIQKPNSLNRVGRYSLGDRHNPARPIRFKGNRIFIPETDGWFAEHPDHADCCQSSRELDLAHFQD